MFRDRSTAPSLSVLPILLQPYSSESGASFLNRLAEANGYGSPSWITELAQGTRRAKTSWLEKDIDELATLCGVSPSVLAPMFPVQVDRVVEYLDERFSIGKIEQGHMQVCPDCLKEEGCHAAAFRLRCIDTCAKHRRRLAHTCSCCRQPIRFTGPSLFFCGGCGEDLRRIDADRVGTLDVQGASLLAHKAGLKQTPHEDLIDIELFDLVFDNPTLHQTAALLNELGTMALEPETVLKHYGSAAAHSMQGRTIAAGGRVVARWPESFFDVLADLGAAAAMRYGRSTGLRPLFLQAHTRLIKCCPSSAITQATISFLSKRWVDVLGSASRRKPRSICAPAGCPEIGPLFDAACTNAEHMTATL